MKALLTPSKCMGEIHIPPSKSMSHRALLCASLASGKSVLSNVAYSQDILTTMEGMRNLGASIEIQEDQVLIHGIKDFSSLHNSEIFCCESGSTLRFFIPLFSLCNQAITFTGQGRLLKRPQQIYADLFHKQGLNFDQDNNGIHIKQSIKADHFNLKGDVSSQFISGLLFALPLLKEDSTIHIEPPFESRSYVDLTLEMLKYYGVNAFYSDDFTLQIKGNQRYESYDYTIEGDYSQLAFFAVLAAIQGDLTMSGVSHDSKQGDKQIIAILRSFHVLVEEYEEGYKIAKSPLIAHDINLENCPDLGPILCVLAMYAKGTTRIYNASRLRIKESDRIEAMECELKKFGVDIHSTQSEIFIHGKPDYTCQETLNGHNDHRIVMALSIASICSSSTCTIEGCEAINKSYPTFFEDLQKIHGKVEIK